jgi:hypothetical protein
MLDERLLNKEKFSFDNELKNIELLKLRFGEQSMHNCVVMLRDIKDSERINNEVNKQVQNLQNSQSNKGFQFDVSKLYVKVVTKGDYWQNF